MDSGLVNNWDWGQFGINTVTGAALGGLSALKTTSAIAAAGVTSAAGSLAQGGTWDQAIFSGLVSAGTFGLTSGLNIPDAATKLGVELAAGGLTGAGAAAISGQDVLMGAFYGVAGAGAGAGINGDLKAGTSGLKKALAKTDIGRIYDEYGKFKDKLPKPIGKALNSTVNDYFSYLVNDITGEDSYSYKRAGSKFASAFISSSINNSIKIKGPLIAPINRALQSFVGGATKATFSGENTFKGGIESIYGFVPKISDNIGALGESFNYKKLRNLYSGVSSGNKWLTVFSRVFNKGSNSFSFRNPY